MKNKQTPSMKMFHIVSGIFLAVSTSFTSLFLLHLDQEELEPIQPSAQMKTAFEQEKTPKQFFETICQTVLAPADREKSRAFLSMESMAERLKGKRYLGIEVQDITGKWYSLQLIPERYDEEGNVQAVLLATDDVTAMKQAEELSFKDKLTGLYNRNYLEAESDHMVQAGDFPTSLIMADCNYLKRTNDTLGHEYGDLLLQRTADAIRESIPKRCVAMRVGGDEFLLVCPQTGEDEAKRLIDAIRGKLAEKSDTVLQLSVSFGASVIDDRSISFAEAYQKADEAMYHEKQASRAARE